MFVNRRARSGFNRPDDELRPKPRFRKLCLLGALVAIFSVVPLPGMEFAPVASASQLSFSSLEQSADTVTPDRVVRGEDVTDPFTLIALTYDAQPKAPVMVRVHSDGQWGDWSELHLEGAAGPDEQTNESDRADQKDLPAYGSEPFFVGTADGYQISIDSETEPLAHVVLVRESLGRVLTDATPVAGAGAPVISGMNSRASWGARDAKSTPNYATTVQMAVVHHSDSGNSYSPSQVPAALRGIQAFHMDGRGWDDIGYNFVVDKYGGIWEGRGGGVDKAVVGAHASGFNTGTVGVMVLGNYVATAPTSASVESVAHVIGWKMAINGVNPTGSVNFTSGGSPKYPVGQVVNLPRVVGHGDVGQTSCPGLVRNSLRTIQNRSIEWASWYRAMQTPFGSLDSARLVNKAVTVSGWAVDPLANGSASVRVESGAKSVTVSANSFRPDVEAAHPENGTSGFNASLTGIGPGLQSVCATILAASGKADNQALGCRTVWVDDIAGTSPVGRFTSARSGPGRIELGGWTADPESAAPITYQILVDGATVATEIASFPSVELPSNLTATVGTSHGFWVTPVGLTGGVHTVCLKAKNILNGSDVLLDCRDMIVGSADPQGSFDDLIGDKKAVWVRGWAFDRETTSPTSVSITIDDVKYTVLADKPRGDLSAVLGKYGDRHGFHVAVPASEGVKRVCVTALNTNGGSDQSLGCKSVTVVK